MAPPERSRRGGRARAAMVSRVSSSFTHPFVTIASYRLGSWQWGATYHHQRPSRPSRRLVGANGRYNER